MQTRALHTLVRVSILGSFAKVAEEMNTTISTVSMQIKAIEEQLSVEIFDRSHRPPKLTPVGKAVCEKAKLILGAEKELLALSGQENELAGNFRIGFVATASVRLLPDFLKNAQENALHASFELETALSEVLEARVQSGILDAAVVTESERERSDLEYHLLRRERLMFAVPKKFADQPVEALRSKLPFLQFNPGSGIGKLIQQHMSGSSTTGNKQDIVLESVEAIIACVNEGLGFTLLSEPDIRRYASATCGIVPMKTDELVRHLSLAIPKSRFSDGARQQLIGLFGE